MALVGADEVVGRVGVGEGVFLLVLVLRSFCSGAGVLLLCWFGIGLSGIKDFAGGVQARIADQSEALLLVRADDVLDLVEGDV